MRSLSILILVLTFAVNGFSQTPSDTKLFTEASALARAGLHHEALEKFRAISVADKKSIFAAKVHFNIGVCLYQLGRHDEAIAEYQKAIVIDPNYQKAYYASGMAQTALGKAPKAKSAFRLALKLNPDDAEAWFDLAMVLLGEKEYDSAKEAFEKAVEQRSVNAADAINNLGVLSAMEGDIEGAKANFKNAWAMSNGASREAIANFNICVHYEKKTDWQFTAALKFSNNKQYSGE